MTTKTKRITCFITAIIVLLGTIPMHTDAALSIYAMTDLPYHMVDHVPTAAAIPPSTTTINSETYHVLTLPGHLAWMQENQSSLQTARFRLEADIIAPDNFRFGPAFNGVLDGNGYSITVNSTLNAPTGGIFHTIGASGIVRNLHVAGIVAPMAGSTGNVAGGLAGTNNGTIENTSSSVTVIHQLMNVGGLVGTNNSTIYNSHATGNVSGGNQTGGLVGQNQGHAAQVTNSFATGNVHGAVSTGGLVGFTNNGTIEGSHAEGNVIGTNLTGGLVGSHGGSSSIIHSHALGSVRGVANIGGLVGRNTGTSSIMLSFAHGSVEGASRVGGLVGENFSVTATISRTFATGNVRAMGAGNHGTGGLVGANVGIITDSYARGNVNSTNINSGALVGINTGSITNAFATGNVVGNGNNLGGLVGNNGNGASLSDSVSLISQLMQTAGATLTRRVSGTAPGTLNNNFAMEGMIINGAVFESLGRPQNLMDAYTVTFEDAQDRDFWENDVNFDFDEIWEWRGEDDYHPIVLNMGGQVFVDVRGLPPNTIPGQGVQLRYAVSRPSGTTYTTIIWSLSGNTSAGTTVDQNGFLTIGHDESPGSVITVTASTIVSFNEPGIADVPESGNAATVVIYGDYAIAVAPSPVVFASQTVGYAISQPDDRSAVVTITNAGNQPTGALDISISPATAFGVRLAGAAQNSITMPSIPFGAASSFMVTFQEGLAVGVHTATITITGSNGISETVSVSFTVMQLETWDISLSTTGTHTFPSAYVGYAPQPPHTVTVTNTGNQPTGVLSVALSDASSFTLSAVALPSLDNIFNVSTTFTIQPNTSLAVGIHTATVTVTGGNGISQSFVISFEVMPTPEFGIALNPAVSYAFPSLEVGYIASPAALSVTVSNVGNQPTGDLTVELSGMHIYSFAINTSAISSINVSGSAIFTVQPILGLPEDTHTATIIVSGDNGISASLNVSFEVLSLQYAPIITVYNAPGGTVGNSYSFTFGATGNPAPVWAITGGSLPIGLTLSPSGTLFGTPSVAGTFTFEITASNAAGYATVTVTIVVTNNSDTGGSNTGGGSTSTPEPDSNTNPPTINKPTPKPYDPEITEYEEELYEEDDTLSHVFSEYHFSFMIGRPDGNIYPHMSITRAEATAILFRLLSDDARILLWSQDNPFPDVNSGQWFNNEVSTIANLGIVHGHKDGTFAPNQAITRAEASAMVARFFGGQLESINEFVDIDGHWAAGYINHLAKLGWVHGYNDGTFRPNQPITRAEFAALINRMLNRVPESTEALLAHRTAWADNKNPNAWYYLYLQEATHSTIFERLESGYIRWVEILPHIDWSVFSRPNSRPDDIMISQ